MGTKKIITKFRPLDYNRGKWLKWSRQYNDSRGLYNYKSYSQDKLLFKNTALLKIGSHLHYLGCHAPIGVRKKWYKSWLRFTKNHPKY